MSREAWLEIHQVSYCEDLSFFCTMETNVTLEVETSLLIHVFQWLRNGLVDYLFMPKCWVFSYPVVKITDTQVQTLYLTRGSNDQKSKGSDAVGS